MPSSKDEGSRKNNDEKRSSDFNSGALDVRVAFPQATPASTFPPSASDYFNFNDLLTPEEHEIRLRVRQFMETEVAPIMTEYWEKAEFPFHLLPKIGALGIVGGTIKGYGCPGISITASAIAMAEVGRVDASLSLFLMVQSSSAMLTIAKGGSEAQKQMYLPLLSQLKIVGSWALTEPGYGSDASSLQTTATKVAGGWILEGQKRWIGNSTFADVLIIFARNTSTNQVNAFIVKKGAVGLQATKIENKIGMRITQNGDILLKNVFVPDEDRLPAINSFQDINKILGPARLMVLWEIIGIAMGAYDMCHRYLKERKQFGEPLAAFQITQMKLVQMLGNIQGMIYMGWRLCTLHDKGTITVGQLGLGKAWVSLKARETVSLGRELLGGNGISVDFQVAKAFCDLEGLYTGEGSYEVNTLIAGREITGISSFKPGSSVPKSRL